MDLFPSFHHKWRFAQVFSDRGLKMGITDKSPSKQILEDFLWNVVYREKPSGHRKNWYSFFPLELMSFLPTEGFGDLVRFCNGIKSI
jgi:hypothetical protein